MRDFLNSILEKLVQDEDAIIVECIETDELISFSVKVATNDVGRVIGRYGSTANALRTILLAASPKIGDNRPVVLDIMEEAISNWNSGRK